MKYTGERMVPEAADRDTFWEHIYRYRFAVPYVRGRSVVDIACGEGYGAAAFQQMDVTNVIAIDVSQEAVEHARRKYGIDARVGDATQIPLATSSVETVISYETIEHVSEPKQFINEVCRILVPNGTFIVSTPNTDIYGRDFVNPFHCSEMNVDAFQRLLGEHFHHVRLFSQRPTYAPWWNLRWIAADNARIYRIRGTRRIQSAIHRVLCPHIRTVPTGMVRSKSVDLILSEDRIGTKLVNRFSILPYKSKSNNYDRPRYVIAICDGPIGISQ